MQLGALCCVLFLTARVLAATVPDPAHVVGATTSISSTQSSVCTDGQCTTTATTVNCVDLNCSSQTIETSPDDPMPVNVSDSELPATTDDET